MRAIYTCCCYSTRIARIFVFYITVVNTLRYYMVYYYGELDPRSYHCRPFASVALFRTLCITRKEGYIVYMYTQRSLYICISCIPRTLPPSAKIKRADRSPMRTCLRRAHATHPLVISLPRYSMKILITPTSPCHFAILILLLWPTSSRLPPRRSRCVKEPDPADQSSERDWGVTTPWLSRNARDRSIDRGEEGTGGGHQE